MPFNGSGTFTRGYSWVADAAANIKINSTRMDTDTNDIATGLSNCVTRDGQGYFQADINANGYRVKNLSDGVASTPALASKNSTNSGVYFPAVGSVGLATAGTLAFASTATASTFYDTTGLKTLTITPGTTTTVNASGVLGLQAAGATIATVNPVGLGIGVVPTTYQLDVSGAINVTVPIATGPSLGLRLYDSNSGAGEGPWISWESFSRVDMARILGAGDAVGGYLAFYTNSAASGSATLRGKFDQNGALALNYAAATAKYNIGNSSTAFTLDCSKSNVQTLTMTGNVLAAGWTITNPYDGQTINLFITQDGTGSRTLGWPTSFKWPGGTAGTISTAASTRDLLVMTYDSTTTFWYCSLAKAFA